MIVLEWKLLIVKISLLLCLINLYLGSAPVRIGLVNISHEGNLRKEIAPRDRDQRRVPRDRPLRERNNLQKILNLCKFSKNYSLK